MKKMISSVILVCLCTVCQGATLYYDDFDGITTLDGVTPDVTIGSNTWAAGSNWLADGTVGPDQSCSLPITLESGGVYTLTVLGITVTQESANWLGVGFHSTYPWTGREVWTLNGPWMYRKGTLGTDDAYYEGPATLGWHGIVPPLTPGEAVDFRITIDKTLNPATMMFEQKLSTDTTWEVLDTLEDVYDNFAAIKSIVLGSCNYCPGSIDSIRLEGPGVVTALNPSNGAKLVSVDTTLSWLSETDYVPSYYDVWFGTDPNLTSLGYDMTLILDKQNITSVDPAPSAYTANAALDYATTYYWKVVVYEPSSPNPIPHENMDPFFSFTTQADIPEIQTEPGDMYSYVSTNPRYEGPAVATCLFASIDAPTAKWYKEAGATDTLLGTVTVGSPLVNNGDYTIELTSGGGSYTSTLSIANVEQADEGQYYCNISSIAGGINTDLSELVIKNMYAWYKFEDDVTDSIGSNNGTVNGSPVYTTGVVNTGGQSKAIQFDDPNFYVALPLDVTPVQGAGEGLDRGSVSCWFKTEEHAGMTLLGFNNSTPKTNSFFLWLQDGWVARSAYAFNDVWVTTGGGTNLYDGQWHLLTATHELGYEAVLYVDGMFAQELPVSSGYSAANALAMYIGARNNDGVPDMNFTGAIDDLKFYNYNLDWTEVADLYLEGYPDAELCILDGFDESLDLFDDCKVDLKDFAELAYQWLSTGIYQP